MSARAAARLESLGFFQVFRYTPGKADWAASGLPLAGKQARAPRAGTLARRDAPTCRLTDRLGEVRERVRAAGWNECVVLNDEGVVLGRLRQAALDSDPEAVTEAVMEPGPTTLRPNMPLASLSKWMRERKIESVVVTTSDGQLIGILRQEDVEQAGAA